jgi:hypothetical protein
MKLFDYLFNKKDQQDHTPTCEGCGLEFPHTHLCYIDIWTGYFCETCSEMEE